MLTHDRLKILLNHWDHESRSCRNELYTFIDEDGSEATIRHCTCKITLDDLSVLDKMLMHGEKINSLHDEIKAGKQSKHEDHLDV